LAHPKGAIGRHHPPNQEFSMKTDYQILPRHEPDGEGNGWETCREKLATAFLVVDLRTDEDADAFDTRGQAQAYVNARCREEQR
jgi:hypothetical protein